MTTTADHAPPMSHVPHPLRIQRRRTKGWRLPAGAVCCTRPGRWGNPFDTASMFRYVLTSILSGSIRVREHDVQYRHMASIVKRLDELRGRPLACWCPPGKPCHVDVLLEFANRPPDAPR